MSPTIRNQVKLAGVALAAGLAFAAFGARDAWAPSPHFNFVDCSLQQDGDVTMAFKESGLGDNQQIDYLASGDVAATFVCLNKGGNVPADPKKTDVEAEVDVPATFTSGKNGSINQSLTLPIPAPDLDCPSGQRETLASVSWTGLQLTDQTTPVGPEACSPSELSATFVELD